jgi:hypothetical protein
MNAATETRRAGLLERIQRQGVSRITMHYLGRYPSVAWATRKGLRQALIAKDLAGYIKRKRMAAEIVKSSPYAGYMPESAFRVAPPGTFKEVDAIIPVAREAYKNFLKHNPSGRLGDEYAFYILHDYAKPVVNHEVADLLQFPEFQELATARPLVEAAAAYLSEMPILGHIGLQVVVPNDYTVGFQKFHIDTDAERQMKVFIAIEDVDEENGATMLLPADESASVRKAIRHVVGRIEDDLLHESIPKEKILHAKGPAGSAFFFDPSRAIHAGARTRNRPRIILHLQYSTKYPYIPTSLQQGWIKFDREKALSNEYGAYLFDLK